MKTLIQTALLATAFFFSLAAFAQDNTQSISDVTFANSLQQQAHVVCHVTKGPRGSSAVNEVELTVSNSKATVVVSYVAPDHTRTSKTFANRNWSVTESYDDYSDRTQYETLVNLTDDTENFLLVQFYSNDEEARGVLQVGPVAYDLICR